MRGGQEAKVYRPRALLPQASGPNVRSTSPGQTTQRNALAKTKRGRHAKRRTALADASESITVGVAASRSFLDNMRTHRQPQNRARARPNCRELAETTLRGPNRSVFCRGTQSPSPIHPDTSPPSPPPPPEEPGTDPPAKLIRRELHHGIQMMRDIPS